MDEIKCVKSEARGAVEDKNTQRGGGKFED